MSGRVRVCVCMCVRVWYGVEYHFRSLRSKFAHTLHKFSLYVFSFHTSLADFKFQGATFHQNDKGANWIKKRVSVVPRRTIVSNWQFKNLNRSHNQSWWAWLNSDDEFHSGCQKVSHYATPLTQHPPFTYCYSPWTKCLFTAGNH